MKLVAALAACGLLVGGISANAAEISGEYLEARTCDVYTSWPGKSTKENGPVRT
jgi:hypothetical protein